MCYFVLVKRVVSIFLSVYLLAGSIFPGNGLASISELPQLLQHYRYHYYVETPGVSFYDFIALHYYDDAHEQSDPAHHQKLPLHHRMNIPPTDRMVLSEGFESGSNFVSEVTRVFPVINDPFITSMNTLGIFHPPKA